MKPDIAQLTKQLRTSKDPLWARLRELLAEKGVNPRSTVVAVAEENTECFASGIVVAAHGDAYQYGISYLGVPVEQAKLTEWKPLGASDAGHAHDREVRLARAMLDQL